MLPHVIIALNDAPVGGFEVPRYEFSKSILDSWFGNSQAELLRRIAAGFSILPGISTQAQYLLRAAIEKAKLQS